MTAPTPGQAACIAWNAHYAEEHGITARNEWAASDERGRAAWEAAAQAGIDAFLAGDSVSGEDIREALAAWQRLNAEAVLAEPDALNDLTDTAPGKP